VTNNIIGYNNFTLFSSFMNGSTDKACA
jgi:hypothetical protein